MEPPLMDDMSPGADLGDMLGDDDEGTAGGDPEAMVRDFGSHPMMHRIQDALYKQLQREYERVTLEMREKEAEVGGVNRKREDVGVELYGTQQQLARLQMALESLHSQSHQLIEGRRKEEGSLDGARSTHASLKSAQSEKEKALLKNQSELDALNETLRQVSPLSAPVVAVSESERPLRRPAGSRQRRVRQRVIVKFGLEWAVMMVGAAIAAQRTRGVSHSALC